MFRVYYIIAGISSGCYYFIYLKQFRHYYFNMLFENQAAGYALYRPHYPDRLIQSLLAKAEITKRDKILDLGCGTGILSEDIARHTSSSIVGTDKSLAMLRFNKNFPLICCSAESLALKNQTFNLVIVGQAFHWFDFKTAFAETKRVLKPNGSLAIIWYQRKRPLQQHRKAITELVKKYNKKYIPGFMEYDWNEVISSNSDFGTAEPFDMEKEIIYTVDDYIKLQDSKSYIGEALGSRALQRFNKEAETILVQLYPDRKVTEKYTFHYRLTRKSN